ncbi:oxidoreductase [Jejuia pallidilutea]|uniref:Oxidoreductase n=2 Tax=Jejuia pallidilutea TaxID=504487 RepID=A0A090WAB8_9FLAO|nr:oxidoreductase [Jejuia pallidilutea]
MFGKILKLEADFGFYRTFDDSHRLFKKSVGGGSLLDIGIYPIFVALSTLGIPKTMNASATYFNNGADASCDMVFEYENDVKAYLKKFFNRGYANRSYILLRKGHCKN